MKTIKLTMAQALIKFLDNQYICVDGEENKFVKGVMGIYGHGNCTGIGQALEEFDGDLKFQQVMNEQGAVQAAVSYAKMKNRQQIYACTTSIGPGALNMVTAAGVATANRLPVLLLPGDIFATRQPDPVLQQVEKFNNYTETANDSFKAVCTYWDRISRPEQLMTAALQAMRTLIDPVNTGAVCLALPQDVQAEAYDYPVEFFEKRIHYMNRMVPVPEVIKRFVEIMKDAKKPMIIVGGGVLYSGAEAEVLEMAKKFNIPLTETHAGKGAYNWSEPYLLGAVGVHGTAPVNRLAKEADVVIGIGTRFTDFTTASKWQFQNENCQFVSVNVNNFDNYKMNALPICADAKAAVKEMIRALEEIDYTSSFTPKFFSDAKAEWETEQNRLYDVKCEAHIAQSAALGIINDHLADDAIIVAAAGTLPGCLQRLWRTKNPGTYNMEYAFSCMGYEIAGALGAKMACPDREVYTIMGDASYMMLNSELFTSVRQDKKITVLLMNNYGCQCIAGLQIDAGQIGDGNEFRKFNPKTGICDGELINVDYVKHAESMGCKGYRVSTNEELAAAIEDAKKQDGSCLIEIMTLKGTETGGYESYWRIGVAETAESNSVVIAHKHQEDHIAVTKKF
ncbi:MAG: 3D-(3,5/4)-trihydroxycyclohexane-1,2-dione acylhydrolase (decyclizing) [Christensenellales bacterium]|jgi:3D-(3,5/4)-trihydroxycyclohexane-1,2-dione acylhydrolase (decyclizing)